MQQYEIGNVSCILPNQVLSLLQLRMSSRNPDTCTRLTRIPPTPMKLRGFKKHFFWKKLLMLYSTRNRFCHLKENQFLCKGKSKTSLISSEINSPMSIQNLTFKHYNWIIEKRKCKRQESFVQDFPWTLFRVIAEDDRSNTFKLMKKGRNFHIQQLPLTSDLGLLKMKIIKNPFQTAPFELPRYHAFSEGVAISLAQVVEGNSTFFLF